MQHDGQAFGNKMGTGYALNENVLFCEGKRELNRSINTESLITCEDSAFLKISIESFKEMTGSGAHFMDD